MFTIEKRKEERKKVKVVFVERKDEKRQELIELTSNSVLFEVCAACKSEAELPKRISEIHPDIVAFNTGVLTDFLKCCDESVATAIKSEQERKKKVEKAIKQKMLDIEIPTKVSAFSYIGDSLFYIMENRGNDISIVKDIYPAVARKHRASVNSVESAIRKTLVRTYEEQVKAGICKLPMNEKQHKVASNGRFLTELAEIISMESIV